MHGFTKTFLPEIPDYRLLTDFRNSLFQAMRYTYKRLVKIFQSFCLFEGYYKNVFNAQNDYNGNIITFIFLLVSAKR